MHEVLHLSFGPQANDLNGLFYNTQQTYFVYSKEEAKNSNVDPSIRFVYGVEYTPRAAFWEFRNGFDKWKQYREEYEVFKSEGSMHDDQQRPIDKISDSGSGLTTSSSSSSSWFSRSKVPLHPSSLHTIPDWEYDAEKFPLGHQRGAPLDEYREFETNDEGSEQLRSVSANAGGIEDYLDLSVRPLLEKCDLLDGINMVTDLSGWAGFTAPYLEALRDEYIPKSPVFTWTLSRDQPKYKFTVQQSRLEALVSISELSSIVLPLQDTIPTVTAAEFTKNNTHHLPVFETTCLLSSLRKSRISMHQIWQDLTIEIPRANLVQLGSSLSQLKPLKELDGGSDRIRNTVEIARGAHDPLDDNKSFEEPDISLKDRSQNSVRYWCPQPLQADQTKTVDFTLQINNSPLKLRKLTSGRNHELRELVYDLTEPYIWGWQDASDDDSDY